MQPLDDGSHVILRKCTGTPRLETTTEEAILARFRRALLLGFTRIRADVAVE